MMTMVDDLVGLNVTPMRDRPLLTDVEQARRVADRSNDCSLSIAGARHTQGGHTAVDDGRQLLTMTGLNRVGVPVPVQGQPHEALLEVEAGATWEEIQRVIGPYGFAPMVQQSSPHFSVGGSIGANCHGRDPRWGPMACSVENLTVLTGKGDLLTASRTEHPELFKAVLGGYGSCGLTVKATLRLVANSMLEYVGDVPYLRRGVADYVAHAQKLDGHPEVHLHYAWLCCVRGRFYDECLIADLKTRTPPRQLVPHPRFKEEDWGDGEILRAGWSAARKDPGAMRQAVWNELCRLHHWGGDGGKGTAAGRIDWLRASVSFTAYRGSSTSDILQEYFVPLEALPEMVKRLKAIFEGAGGKINVLSTTLRVVRADGDDTVLSYCRDGARACIAVDAEVSTVGSGQTRELDPDVKAAIASATAAALELGGSYYLPYCRVADVAQFRRAYVRHDALQVAIEAWNPKVDGRHRYWNRFLNEYFV